MSLDFRTVSIHFDPTRGQTQTESGTVVFDTNVKRAEAALKGFNIAFSADNRPLSRERIQTATRWDRNTVNVTVDYLLRDTSGEIDDPFEGWVDVLVVADVEDPVRFDTSKQSTISKIVRRKNAAGRKPQ